MEDQAVISKARGRRLIAVITCSALVVCIVVSITTVLCTTDSEYASAIGTGVSAHMRRRRVAQMLTKRPEYAQRLLRDCQREDMPPATRAVIIQALYQFSCQRSQGMQEGAEHILSWNSDCSSGLTQTVHVKISSEELQLPFLRTLCEQAGLKLGMTEDAKVAFVHRRSSVSGTLGKMAAWEAIQWVCFAHDCGWDIYDGVLYVDAYSWGSPFPPLDGRKRLEKRFGTKMSFPPEKLKYYDSQKPLGIPDAPSPTDRRQEEARNGS